MFMYFITTITNLPGENVPFTDERRKKHRSRCVGYFESLERAANLVESNACDLHETIYEFAVIEKLGEGIYPTPEEEHWFAFNDALDRYEPIEKPSETNHTCNWAIG